MKYTLMACAAAAALVGCATTYDEGMGGPGPYVDKGIVEGANRGVNTNYFGPIYSGADAAGGVGTASGGATVRP
ncbi:MAG TPA: hypothetical protein VFC26_14835 [Verrucomicrobiae bacterium]|nr:hypothetical protein [Verrucomicrobiae bacterium]